MQFSRGARLGPYEVEGPLGAGGMGEVFRARDTRLDRSVAIKVLPSVFASDAQLRLRFEREAKVISQLTHPNICTLHDVGISGDVNYLVMELLDGETLANRLKKGPLDIEQVLRFGTQIAEALDSAHRAGIVHRDLKPGNIMLTKNGAKLLDFGLARSTGVPRDSAPDESTYEQEFVTTGGLILGTPQYMAPEQLGGEELDGRADIFALGAALYEMATGKRAFQGSSRTSLIAAIIGSEPQPISEIQPLTPPAFEHVVKKCLSKDRENRWQSAYDVAEELRWISEAGSQARRGAVEIRRKSGWLRAAAIAGFVVALASIATGVILSRRTGAASPIFTDLAVRLAWNRDAPLAVSWDGRKIVVMTGSLGTKGLILRDLTTGESRALPGTDGAIYPFWSPDNRTIGFFASAKLKTINVDTGAVQVICDAPFGRGGSWGTQGYIVFAPNIGTGLVKVPENGGTPTPITKVTGNGTHRNPLFLPDGKHFLYCAGNSRGTLRGSSLRLGSIDGGVDKQILDYASKAEIADGWLLTVREHNLVAQKFDTADFTLSGKPVVLAQNVDEYDSRYTSVFGAGADLLAYHRAPHPRRQLLRVNRAGLVTASPAETAEYTQPEVSPDGRRCVVNRYDPASGKSDLYAIDLQNGASTRLTFDATGSMEDFGRYSPDGQRIALITQRPDGAKLWLQPAGGGATDLVLQSPDFLVLGSWSPDGRSILVSPQNVTTGQDLAIVQLDGDRKMHTLMNSPANEFFPQFSPDGRWIAYVSDETGRPEVYVASYPITGAKWQISSNGGIQPHWSADGKQIFFLDDDAVYVADVHGGSSFASDAPRKYEPVTFPVDWIAVGADGTMVVTREVDADEAPVTVVTNWTSLLAKR